MTSSDSRTPTRVVAARWAGRGDVFHGKGGAGGEATLDGDGVQGPSPTEALLLSLASCMGIDIRMILEKGRVPVEALEVEMEGTRRDDPPRYFTAIRMVIRVDGPGEDHRGKVERAVRLSEEKYCSVLHTLRPELELGTEIRLS